ncbi:MAG: BrnA antitoxin family protein [Acidobacteriota bacterium]
MRDEDIDTSDIPPLGESFFEKADLRLPEKKVALTACVDPDILEWFQAQGKEYQEIINAALRLYVEAHRQKV